MVEKPDDASNRRPIPDPTVLTTEQLLREIAALKDFLNIRIDNAEKLNEEKFKAAKIAVDAALQAAKDAVEESKKSTEKQIDRIIEGADQKAKNNDVQINDLKDRFNRGEGKGIGLQAGWGLLVTMITLAAIIFGVVMALKK